MLSGPALGCQLQRLTGQSSDPLCEASMGIVQGPESANIHLLLLSSQGHGEVGEHIRFVNTELGTERFSE